jgi:hypothetical protein
MEGLPQNFNILRIIERIREEREAVKQRRDMLMALENRDAMILDLDAMAIYDEACRILRQEEKGRRGMG